MKFSVILFLISITTLSTILHAETRVNGNVEGVWDLDGSPYIATGELAVADGRRLQIEPGVEVRLRGDHPFVIHGKLEAVGTEQDSILLRGIEERSGGVRFMDADSLSILSYCILTDGQANHGEGYGDQNSSGGNIFIFRGDVLIEHSRITNGSSRGFGGGIAIWNSSPVIRHCLINENIGATNGGGMEIIYESFPTISDCQFTDNNSPWAGGGICIERDSDPLIENCTFTTNSASAGGGIGLYFGSSPEITHCDFIENRASLGGAMYLRNEGSRPVVDWCYFYRNQALDGEGRSGGAILIRDLCEPEIRYSRFIENQARIGGAIAQWDPPYSAIHHNLFISNRAHAGGVFDVRTSWTKMDNKLRTASV